MLRVCIARPISRPAWGLLVAALAGLIVSSAGCGNVQHLGDGWISWTPPQPGEAWGWIAAFLVPGETHRVGRIRAGLVVQQIGFETPSGDDGEPK